MTFLALCALAALLAFSGRVAVADPTSRSFKVGHGVAGAARGIGGYAVRAARGGNPAPAAIRRPAKGKRSGSTATQPTTIIGAVRTGWASEVERAAAKRAAGRDLVGRTRRAVRWSADRAGGIADPLIHFVPNVKSAWGEVPWVMRRRAAKAEKQAALDAANNQHRQIAEDGQPQKPGMFRNWHLLTDPPAPAGPAPDRNPAGVGATPKENSMRVQTTDLATVDTGIAEGERALAALEALEAALAEFKAAAGTIGDRYAGVSWGTSAIDQAVTTIAEGNSPEQWREGYSAFVGGCKSVKAAAEPMTAAGARGDVAAYA